MKRYMLEKVVKLNTILLNCNEGDFKKAGEIIASGGTVIFPTETVYGLGANALDSEAVKKIFIAKGRPSDNPLIVHIDDFGKIGKYVEEVTVNAKKLADAYWPGPMTLILRKKSIISDSVSAGLDTVGIRIPESEEAREFLRACDLPVAAPSANLSGSPSPTTYKHVVDDMLGRVDAIINGRDCDVGVESTVIDVTGEIPIILRPGAITPEMVEKVCGSVIIDKGVNGVSSSEKPRSPGMKYRHYAPKAKVILIEDEKIENIVGKMLNEAKKDADNSIILCTEQTKEYFKGFNVMVMGDRNDPKTVARKLFDAFRRCDEDGYKFIVLEGIREEGIGLAVMNRAHRAANA